MQVELESPYVLVTNYKINNIQEILPILEQVLQSTGLHPLSTALIPLLIILRARIVAVVVPSPATSLVLFDVDESNGFDNELEISEGMQYDKGYVSPYMVSDREKMQVDLESPYVLVTNYKINNIQEILPILEQVLQANKPLLLVAEDFENEVISTLVLNKLRGTFNVVATKAPGFGDNQKEMLQDIAALTNAKFYNKDLNMKLEEMKLEELGTIKKVIVTKDNTTMISGNETSEELKERNVYVIIF